MRTVRGPQSWLIAMILVTMISPDSTMAGSGKANAAAITQADYVIITPQALIPTVQTLAEFREARNSFTVATVSTEDIYATFGQGIPADSAIRSFIAYTLSGGWAEPRPRFFLLAGGIGSVPSHKEAGVITEDSVYIDQWLIEGFSDTTVTRPCAALGRFPTDDSGELAGMIARTIAYENTADSSWFGRALAAADYTTQVGPLFEEAAYTLQQELSSSWHDTTTAHVRSSSPLHRTREEFRSLWNQGTAVVSFIGMCNSIQFSGDAYFTIRDVDSLADNSPLTFCVFEGSQHFERVDTSAIAVRLLNTATKGAVASLAPSGPVFAYPQQLFIGDVFHGMAGSPDKPIGEIVLDAKRRLYDPEIRRKQTLLGDPAVVIRHSTTTGVINPPQPVPATFGLAQNYPNPFNPATTIRFRAPYGALVSLKVFDVLGRDVATLFSGRTDGETVTVQWKAAQFPSGVYFYRLRSNEHAEVRRMLLIR